MPADLPLESQPVITQQTIAQNEAISNVLDRFNNKEIVIPPYQRDADQWDDIKKSLFIESILNRLTVPAFYFALSEGDSDISEVVDGQQRLTTLLSFYNNEFSLSKADECPYYGYSSHYAGMRFNQLSEVWQRAFRRYNLTLVTLPGSIDLSLRLEIFRRINEGGTPLSGQDIRLSYYCQSPCVRFIQLVGISDTQRQGSQRMIAESESAWPWDLSGQNISSQWREWWLDSKAAVGQTASKMFLWYLISEHRNNLDKLLNDANALSALRVGYRGNTEEVLDIFCAQLRQEDLDPESPRLFPNHEELASSDFDRFSKWWYNIIMQCGNSASTARHRHIALLIPKLDKVFGEDMPSFDQWSLIARFLKSSRDTAKNVLGVELPEPKGKWSSQQRQIEAFDQVVEAISMK